MVVQSTAPPPLRIALGLGFLAGAAVLAWFSAIATLHLTRTGAAVSAEIEARMFGLIPIASERLDGIRAVGMESGCVRNSGAACHTPNFLVFLTPDPVDLGYRQQLFFRDYSVIEEFFATDAARTLEISSIALSSETRRFVFAQVIVVFLAACGLLLVYQGIRGLFPDPNAGIGSV